MTQRSGSTGPGPGVVRSISIGYRVPPQGPAEVRAAVFFEVTGTAPRCGHPHAHRAANRARRIEQCRPVTGGMTRSRR